MTDATAECPFCRERHAIERLWEGMPVVVCPLAPPDVVVCPDPEYVRIFGAP